MTTVSFKTDTGLKRMIDELARRKGINTSAYIKLLLTKEINDELSQVTVNGLTVAEELEILASHKEELVHGPYKTARSLLKALKS